MAAAGVELAFDLTRHSVIGLSEVFRQVLTFRRLLNQLVELAVRRQPDVIVCVDFHGFNGRFAAAVRRAIRARRGLFNNWQPRIVHFVSPQVWASRPGRAVGMTENLDLLLSIFPFEKAWYEQNAPKLRVEFVGHPMVDRFTPSKPTTALPATPRILLLPGSRSGEVTRHLHLVLATAKQIIAQRPATFRMVLPNAAFAERAQAAAREAGLELAVQVGGIEQLLPETDLAISKTGTVLMECAWFGVPAVAFYQTSALTYAVGKRLVKVKWLSMPNLIADEALFPEFIQHEATPEQLAQSALQLLDDPTKRTHVKRRLTEVIDALGKPGATRRAATHIIDLLERPSQPGHP
jgi:lipid-A-disaccharide synthase